MATGDGKPWLAPAAQAKVQNPISPNESSLAAGEKIYMKRCAACHGKTGNGDGHDAVDLGIHPAKFSDPKLRGAPDGALYWKITAGKKPMPDYGSRLSKTDRWNIIHFLRTLAEDNRIMKLELTVLSLVQILLLVSVSPLPARKHRRWIRHEGRI
jgi:mono/diheme cytochrome c family protein